MTGSSPTDLAVAFRSLARRRGDVVGLAGGDPSTLRSAQGSLDSLASVVGRAGELLRLTPSDDLAVAGGQIADAIEATPADQWDEATLDELRTLALDAGKHLRDAQSAVEQSQG